jgi:type IV pilus assembly protein PilE
MLAPSPSHLAAARQRGFSLMELMIAVAIVSVLLAVALPSFNSQQRKSHRTDAFAALSAAQAMEERYRSNNSTYGSTTQLSLATTSPSGYYSIAVVDNSNTATGYIITATAVSGKSQVNDTGCQVLGVKMDSGNLFYGSASATIDWSDPAKADANKCWAK